MRFAPITLGPFIFSNVLFTNSHEHRNFSEFGHDEAVNIVIEMDALDDCEKDRFKNRYSCPIYGTLSRKDKLTPRGCSTLMTHVLIPSEADRATLTKMSVALVINEEN